MNNDFGGNTDRNDPFNIFDNRGRPKNIKWSVASAVCGFLSIALATFGWAGLVFGIAAVVFSIVARKSLGYFNGWSIAGLLTGIFGTVFSVALIVIAYTNPALIVEIFGFSGVPGTPDVPELPSDTNNNF